jgi:HTH-type transcriptional regulator, transcriptional repressor of NAD biosynthesis genes
VANVLFLGCFYSLFSKNKKIIMLRVVITGPESTGKTTLAKAIAAHFNVPVASEYAREYLEKKLNDTSFEKKSPSLLYNEGDFRSMMLGQFENELIILDKIILRKSTPLMISDTDMLTFKIWHDEVFYPTNTWLSNSIENNIYKMIDAPNINSIYLLCSPEGIIWQADPLRENPTDRDRLFDIYKKNLSFYGLSYFILRGSKEKRLAEAIKIINRLRK